MRVSLRGIVVGLVLASTVAAAQGARQQRVAFKPGSTSATLAGMVTGGEAMEFVLGARGGQTLSVTLKAGANASYTVLPPGSEAAIAIGETVGPHWSGTLPANGDYRIRVFLNRAAARRRESASFTLTVAITGSAAAVDVKVPGTPFHATGKIPCSVGPDPKGSAQCSFGVVRRGRDQAEVHLAAPGFDVMTYKEQVRVLRFAAGRVTSSAPDEKVSVQQDGDTWSVAVNAFYFYSIPDAVINGG